MYICHVITNKNSVAVLGLDTAAKTALVLPIYHLPERRDYTRLLSIHEHMNTNM